MKKMISILLGLLLCFATLSSALAAAGCGNQHYFTCGGDKTDDNTEIHAPRTNQKFKCYEHVTKTNKSECETHKSCIVTTTTIYHHYKCMRCTYGSDGAYETQYRSTTKHSNPKG